MTHWWFEDMKKIMKERMERERNYLRTRELDAYEEEKGKKEGEGNDGKIMHKV